MTTDTGNSLIMALDSAYKKDPNVLNSLITLTNIFISNSNFPYSIERLKKELIINNINCSQYDADFLIYSLENEEYFNHLLHISPYHIKSFLLNYKTLFSVEIARIESFTENPTSLYKIFTISTHNTNKAGIIRFLRADNKYLDISADENFYLSLIDIILNAINSEHSISNNNVINQIKSKIEEVLIWLNKGELNG